MDSYQFTIRGSFGEKVLEHPPINWDSIEDILARNSKLNGVVSNIQVKLNFGKDAFTIVRDLFFNEGIDAYMQIQVDQLVSKGWKSSTNREIYYADFSSCEVNDTYVTVDMVDSYFLTHILDRESNDIDLDTTTSIDNNLTLDEVEYETVLIHDRTLLLRGKYEVYQATRTFSSLGVGDGIDMTEQYNDNEDFGSVIGYQSEVDVTPNYSSPQPAECLMCVNSDKSIVLNVSVDLNLGITPGASSGDIALVFIKTDEDGKAIESSRREDVILTMTSGNNGVYSETNFTVDFTETIEEGEGCFFVFHVVNVAQSVVYDATVKVLEDSFITINNVDSIESSPTECKAMLPFEVLERLLKINTGVKLPLHSPVFGRTDLGYDEDGDLAYKAITNGYFIRQFPVEWEDEDETIRTNQINASITDFWNTFNGITPLAAYIEKYEGESRLVVDKIENIFDNSNVIATFSDISDLKIAPNTDKYFSTIVCGYEDVEHEDLNALGSFGGEVNYMTPVGNTSNEYNIQCKWGIDDYSIALAQRKPYSDYPTTDTRYDDKNYILDCYRSGDYLVMKKDEDFDTVTGIFAPEKAMNLDLSPTRNFWRHKKLIKSCVFRKLDKNLTFTKGAINDALVTKRSDEDFTVYENEDIAINDLGTPFFVPNFISFKTKTDNETYDYIKANRNKVIELIVGKDRLYGFIEDSKYNRLTTELECTLLQSNR